MANSSWKKSKRPGKQRKYRHESEIHRKRKLLSANLSKELRKKYGKRSMVLRKGDVVKIMRGKFRKKTGKISLVDIKRSFAEVEGMQMKKQDGSKANVKFYPSKLQITQLYIEDKKRGLIPREKENPKQNKPGTETGGEKKNAP